MTLIPLDTALAPAHAEAFMTLSVASATHINESIESLMSLTLWQMVLSTVERFRVTSLSPVPIPWMPLALIR